MAIALNIMKICVADDIVEASHEKFYYVESDDSENEDFFYR